MGKNNAILSGNNLIKRKKPVRVKRTGFFLFASFSTNRFGIPAKPPSQSSGLPFYFFAT